MRKRLFAVAAVALLPALGLLAYNELSLRASRQAEVHAQAAQAARLAALEVDLVIEGARSLVIAVSAIPAVNELKPAACSEVIGEIAGPVASIEAVIVLDRAGKVVCSTTGEHPDTSLADRPYFKEALAGDDVAVGVYTLGRLSRRAVLPVARAMRRNGQVVGVVVAGLKLGWLQQRLTQRGVVPGGAYTIADREGTILARNPLPERFVGTAIPERYRNLVTAKEPGTTEVLSQDGTERILGYRPISGAMPLYVSAGLSRDEAFADVNKATGVTLAMIILGAVLALAAANFVGVRFIIRPIEEVIRVIRHWAEEDTAARTRMAGQHGEIGLVGVAVDELLDELDRRQEVARRAETAKELVSQELAHRLKNTMAIIQVIAKQTFKRLGNTDEFATFTARLHSLSGAYDVLLAGGGKEGHIADVVSHALAPHDEPGRSRFTLSGPDILLPAGASLALSLTVHELATNAAKYGALRLDDGKVDVQWHVDRDTVTVSWSERNGPLVRAPATEGFGSTLIRRAFSSEFKPEASFEFDPAGLKFSLRFILPQSAAASMSASTNSVDLRVPTASSS